MIHLIVKPSVIIPLIALLTLSPPVSAEEKEEKDTLEEEISELEDADYPDLVPVDEESELMDEFALLQEEEIIFSAAKHQQEISESPSTITVITREQIENTHCIDVTCLLRQVPEIEVRRVMPGYHSVGARALASEQGDKVMLLIDGREDSTDAFGTTFWMNQPLHLEDIKRIEVVRGPGSALYGANAHSVVVSVTTRDIDSSSAAAFLGAGEHGRESLQLRVDQVLGGWNLRVNGGLDYADHWRLQDVSEFEIYRAGLRLERKWAEAVSRLDLSFMNMDGNIFTLLAPARMRDTYSGTGRSPGVHHHPLHHPGRRRSDQLVPLQGQPADRRGQLPLAEPGHGGQRSPGGPPAPAGFPGPGRAQALRPAHHHRRRALRLQQHHPRDFQPPPGCGMALLAHPGAAPGLRPGLPQTVVLQHLAAPDHRRGHLGLPGPQRLLPAQYR
jgi:hypothetical protein